MSEERVAYGDEKKIPTWGEVIAQLAPKGDTYVVLPTNVIDFEWSKGGDSGFVKVAVPDSLIADLKLEKYFFYGLIIEAEAFLQLFIDIHRRANLSTEQLEKMLSDLRAKIESPERVTAREVPDA